MAEQAEASIIVVGGHGRKGQKADETVLGTCVQFLSLDQRFPCLVVKDRKPRIEKPDKCLRYGVCFDGSDKSKKALDFTLSMMQKGDKLATFTIRENMQGCMTDDMIRHHVAECAGKHGITKNIEVHILDKESDKKVCETLEEFIHTNCSDITKHGYIDFIACGNVGMNFASRQSEKYLGSVANMCLRMRKMNTIFLS